MRKEVSSTKWDRTYINEPLMAMLREIWLDAIARPQVKIAKHIQRTVYPDGTICYR